VRRVAGAAEVLGLAVRPAVRRVEERLLDARQRDVPGPARDKVPSASFPYPFAPLLNIASHLYGVLMVAGNDRAK
jgi:hypothetical protein